MLHVLFHQWLIRTRSNFNRIRHNFSHRSGFPKVVFFDLGDTLIHLKPEVYEKWAHEIQLNKGSIEVDSDVLKSVTHKLKGAIRQAWKEAASEDLSWIQTETDECKFWCYFYSLVLTRLNVSSNGDELMKLMARQAAEPNSYIGYANVMDSLYDLRNRGLELGFISNAFPSAEKILRHLHLLPTFQYIIFSYEKPRTCQKPYTKPFPEIYHHALRCARAKPQEVLLVDDRASFVEGVNQAGMLAVLIDRKNTMPGWNKGKIQDLSELPRLEILQPAAKKTKADYT